MKLTKENVNKIFKDCIISFNEWKKNGFPIENVPDGIRLLIPLPNGVDTLLFHHDKLEEHKQEIGELLDQVPTLSFKTPVSLMMLGRTIDKVDWSTDPYEIQQLYLLGAVTDQLVSFSFNGMILIGRITEQQRTVDLVKVSSGKAKVIERRFGTNSCEEK
ncbi:MAG: hypothetical protein HFG40_00530 [Bacilli bacterium]|nr:hypothetical protein [Bacilli bacterium]